MNMEIKRRPWQLQKELVKLVYEKGFKSFEELKQLVVDVRHPIAKILFIMLYLTGARINEILQVRKKDIYKDYINGKEYLIIETPNEKNRKVKRKFHPIPYDKEGFFIRYIEEYIRLFNPEQKLFEFKRNRAYKLLRKHFGMNPHFIRHMRLTHLVARYGFNDNKLKYWAGWSDTRPASAYVSLRWQDLAF